MDNKELPQEIVSEIRQYAIKQCGGDYEGGMKGIQKDLLIGAYTTGAEIAHVYCNSIIEGKDKEIGELKEKVMRLQQEADDPDWALFAQG